MRQYVYHDTHTQSCLASSLNASCFPLGGGTLDPFTLRSMRMWSTTKGGVKGSRGKNLKGNIKFPKSKDLSVQGELPSNYTLSFTLIDNNQIE